MSGLKSDALYDPPVLSTRASLWVLSAVGLMLTGGLVTDVFVDWTSQGEVPWLAVLENSVPTLLALSIPCVGWQLSQSTPTSSYLPGITRGTLAGSLGMIVLSGLVLGSDVLQDQIKPALIILQMTTVGAAAGLWVGYSFARAKNAEGRAKEDRDRLSNLLHGLPVPVVHGRVQGDRLHILQANAAFEEVFGRESGEVVGEDLNEIVVPEERRKEAPKLDRQAIDEGLVETEVKCLTSDGPRDFLLRVAQALDDGASETYSVYTDITEQKKRESELKQMREEMELALKHTGSLLFGINLETESVWRRGPFEKFFGVEAEEVSTMETFFDRAIHPEDRERLRLFYQRLAEGKEESGKVEYRTNPERGSCRWIRDNIKVDNAGSRQLLGLAQDITEQKDRQEELRRKERQYQAVFEDPNILVGLYDTDGHVLDINQPALEFIDPTLEELVGKPIWDTPWFEGNEEAQRHIQELVHRGSNGEYVEFELDLSQSTGPPLVVDGIVRPVTDEEGVVTSLLISGRDVTEKKEQEKELRLFKQAIEQANDAVLVTEARPLDEPGPRILYVNPAFEEMTGYRQEEIEGKTPRILQGPETEREVLNSLREALEDGESWSGNTINYRRDGEPFHLQWSIAPVRNEEGSIEYWASIQRDITEERAREESLRQQKSLLEQAQRLTGAWEVDLRSGEMSWSDKIYEIHEVDPGTDVSVEEGMKFYAPEVRPRVREAYKKCTEEGVPYDLEAPLVTAEGNRRWVRTVGAPAEKKDGEVVKVAGAFQDVTERWEAQRALKKSEERFRGVFENAAIGIALANNDGELLEINPALREMTGYSAEELQGIHFEKLTHPEDLDADKKRYEELVEGERNRYQMEKRYERKNGEVFWGRLIVSRHEEGVVAMVEDIDEQRRHEKQLREAKTKAEEAETLFETIFENVPVMIEVLDFDTGYRRVNDHLEEVLGWTTEELEKHPNTTELFYSSPEEQKRVRKLVKAAPEGWHEIQPQAKSGEILDTLWTFAKLPNDRRLAIGLDISQRKKRERALTQAKEEAEEASRLKTAMLANMSHEIRTPLTSITGFSEMLQENLDGELKLFATKIYKSSQRLQRTLESVLHLSTLEAGVEELEKEEVSLGAVVEGVVDVLDWDAKEKSLAVTTVEPDSPVLGYWNEDAIHRICRNLLENAIKFTPEGGRIDVRVSLDEQDAILEVEDTGIGMDPGKVPRLFKPFKQESEGLDREYEGTGLGLSIVKRLVEELGGQVDVETEKDVGTCFTIRLPLNHPSGSNKG